MVSILKHLRHCSRKKKNHGTFNFSCIDHGHLYLVITLCNTWNREVINQQPLKTIDRDELVTNYSSPFGNLVVGQAIHENHVLRFESPNVVKEEPIPSSSITNMDCYSSRNINE